MICPRCHNLLVASTRQSVEIDFCPVCRGVWLDKGELEKIIERSNPYGSIGRSKVDQEELTDDQANAHSQGERQKGKKRGFFAELFDF